MTLSVSFKSITNGVYGTFDNVLYQTAATKFGPAIALLKLDETLFDIDTLMKSSGGSVTIAGTLPNFGATPTFNLGTLGGAATAAKQPALGTAGVSSTDVISIQGIASGTQVPVSIASMPSTPITAAALPLPAGAATSAKQPALGTAGTPSADIISIQGATSMTPVKTDPSGVVAPISATSLPLPTGAATNAGSASIATAQVSVTTGNITVVAARAGRFEATIINHGTTAVFLGVTGVSITTGIFLPGVVGASVTLPTAAAIFGTVASGTQTVSVLETF